MLEVSLLIFTTPSSPRSVTINDISTYVKEIAGISLSDSESTRLAAQIRNDWDYFLQLQEVLLSSRFWAQIHREYSLT